MSHMTEAKKAVGDLEEGNARGIDSIIVFLQADEYDFGSGYLKERCWHLLKRVRLKESQKRRLRAVGIRYLQRPMRREFWYMCRFMPLVADEGFRSQIEELANGNEANIKRRAILLRAYLQGPEEGERMRREFKGRPRS